MSDAAIVVEGVSKRFRVSKERPTSLKERVTRLSKTTFEEFWALRDVSLSVPKGSVHALVGHNGSGKSSLLRIMAGIYRPTSGTVRAEGRISALLELGAGFHPDLSGRENIYLNAAILGMTTAETDRLLDDIVEFSGIREFIDTPVKHYSSGMYVRLGFSVAVHVHPDILIIDEVIAVGDEEFQRRCFDHLNYLRRQGTTIVMVTHGLGFVQSMADEATWLDHGEILAQGKATDVVKEYVGQVNEDEADRLEAEAEAGHTSVPAPHGTTLSVQRVELLDAAGSPTPVARSLEPVTIRVHWRAHRPVSWPLISFAVENEAGQHLANPGMRPPDDERPTYLGEGHADYHLDRLLLAPGTYRLTVAAHDVAGRTVLDRVDDAFTLRVQPGGADFVVGMVDLGGSWRPVSGTVTSEAPEPVVGTPEAGPPPVDGEEARQAEEAS